MKTTTALAASCVFLLAPASAFAEGYGKPGQIEAGGLFSIESETQTLKLDAPGADEIKITNTTLLLAPTVGYFVADGVQVIGQLELGQISSKLEGDSDPNNATLIILGAGGGYFLDLGVARVGPQLLLRYGTFTFSDGDEFESSSTGFGAQLGAFVKLPINSGGVLQAGLVYDHLQVTDTTEDAGVEFEEEGTETQIGVRVGFSVYF